MEDNNSLNLVEVYKGLIKSDRPLVVHLFRNDGTLLFRKHTILTKEQSLAVLKHGNIYTLQTELLEAFESGGDEEEQLKDWQKSTPYERTELIVSALQDSLTHHQTDLEFKIFSLVNRLKIICDTDYNQAIGFCLLNEFVNKKTLFPVLIAILAYLCSKSLDWKANETNKLMSAALMLDADTFQLLNRKDAVAKLCDAGIKEELWLKYIGQLHEEKTINKQHDVEKVDQPLWGTSLLSLIVEYVKHVYGLDVTQNFAPFEAIRHSVKNHCSRYEYVNRETIFRIVGCYPIGTLIRFMNDDVGIVIKQGDTHVNPYARIFCDIKKRKKHQVSLHRVGIEPFKIKEILLDQSYLNILIINKLWH